MHDSDRHILARLVDYICVVHMSERIWGCGRRFYRKSVCSLFVLANSFSVSF